MTIEENIQTEAVEEVEKENQDIQSQQSDEQEQTEEQKEGYQRENFRKLREQNESLQKELAETNRKQQEAMQQLQLIQQYAYANQQPQQQQQHEEQPSNYDYVTYGDQAKKEAQLRQELDELKLRSQYKDIDNVLTAANMQKLRQHDPELGQMIDSNPNFYNKAVVAYRNIKKMGIVRDDEYLYDKQRIQENAQKPKSVNSIAPEQGESPLARANAFSRRQMSEEERKRIYENMQSIINS